MMNSPCRCGCGRYGNCSWEPYFVVIDDEEGYEAKFEIERMPDILILGLGDSYDDSQLETVLAELLRLRRMLGMSIPS